MSARVYFMKTVNGFKEFSCFTKYNRIGSQNINKQIVNIADTNLTDYSFRSRYHYTKSKNYLKGRYRIRH